MLTAIEGSAKYGGVTLWSIYYDDQIGWIPVPLLYKRRTNCSVLHYIRRAIIFTNVYNFNSL